MGGANWPESLQYRQQQLCREHGSLFCPALPGHIVGIARNIDEESEIPINGLRHPPTETTSGWYLWRGGEIPQDDPDFFQPLHAAHLDDALPEVLPLLGLSPGWRFLVAGERLDIWYEPALLDVE